MHFATKLQLTPDMLEQAYASLSSRCSLFSLQGASKSSLTPAVMLVQADDGYLYPLERAFFYIQKPPTLLVHDEIESVEFLRQGGGMLAASAKTFDLSIRMQGDQVCLFSYNNKEAVVSASKAAPARLHWLRHLTSTYAEGKGSVLQTCFYIDHLSWQRYVFCQL